MYGAVQSQSKASKASTLAVVAGCATFAAVVGLLGFSQSSSLYSATSVRPAVQTAVVPVSGARYVARSAAAPVIEAVQYTAAEESSSVSGQVVRLAPLAFGAAILAAIAAFAVRKEPTVAVMEPIAMAATSGERLVWFPGAKAPAHLTGQYPGDRGFDPLGFSKDPKTFERMRIAEVFHGRLAMIGIVGCVFPEALLQKATWFDTDVDWYRFGVVALQLIAPLEYWRGNGGFSWKGGDVADRSYPGFDPLGLTTEDTKLKEIKNGRLAMIGMLGLEVQNHTTGKSPLANLAAHLADPLHNNILAGSVAMFSTSGQKSDRPLWFPGGYAPSYLTGEYPGDRGFDPAGLAADKNAYARYRVAEIFHGRLAMLAVAGALFQEYIGKGAWYEGPAAVGFGQEQLGAFILLAGLPEVFRGQGGFSAGKADKIYPGFDPLKLNSEYNKEAEIKNGRLAMVAIAGFAVQHKLTGQSPINDLLNHWNNPVGSNIAANLYNPPVAMFAASGQKDGVWFPGAKAPAHLTGEFPGDRGFDPLGLAVDSEQFARMRISEVFHGRLAMLGVAGSLLPEILGKGAWFQAGEVVDGVKVGLVLMAIAAPTEYWRGQGGFGWDKGSGDATYPGFDPLKLTSDRNKVAEIKNGRLAMAAILGFAAQYQVTGESPLANLATHVGNPLGANIATNLAFF